MKRVFGIGVCWHSAITRLIICLSPNLCPTVVQVNKVCPALVSQVLSQITETVAEELSRLMSCVTKFSPSGSQQAHIDVTALQRCLKPFIDHKAQWVSCVFTIEFMMKHEQVQEFNIRTSYSQTNLSLSFSLYLELFSL